MSLLELQVADLDEDVDFLFDEQVIQDERLLGLENRALDVENRMLDVENEVEGSFLTAYKDPKSFNHSKYMQGKGDLNSLLGTFLQ